MATNLSGKERSKKIKGIVGPSQEASWLKSTYSEKKPVLEMPANILTSFDQDDKRTLAPELQMSIVPKDLCFHELESVVKIKQVEAKMFQSHADDARREAEGLNIWKICSKENSDAAWRKHRSSHLSSPFLNVQPPPLLQLRRNVALVRRASASFLAKLLRLFFGQPLFELLSPLFSPLRRVFEPLFSLCSAAFQPPFRHCLPPFSHLRRDLKLLPFPVLFEFQNWSILG
ncbi:hypothetical protein HN51_055779 [Arachis hypogaea]